MAKAQSKRCYLCQKNGLSHLFNKFGYAVLHCDQCGLLSLDFKDNYYNFLSSYYQKGYFTGNKSFRAYANYKDDKENIIKNARKLLAHSKNHVFGNRLLDVGCAMGFFMEEAQAQGFVPFGIEVSDYAARVAQKKFRDKIFVGPVEKYVSLHSKKHDVQPFDMMILSDIIEHLQNPREVLRDLRSLLEPRGVVVLQTGDVDSLWAKMLGKNWHFFAPPQHLYFFSKKTLTELLSQAGYRVIRVEKIGKTVSMRYLLHMLNYMNIPLLGDFLYSVISKASLGRVSFPVKLFDNMVVFAAKK